MKEQVRGHNLNAAATRFRPVDLVGGSIDAGARFRAQRPGSGAPDGGLPGGGNGSPIALRETTLRINGEPTRWRETADFPTSDPWSQQLRGVLGRLRENGAFVGRDILEAGLGDGRNIAVAVGNASHETVGTITGVDLDPQRVPVGRENLIDLGIPEDRLRVHESDAVAFINGLTGSENLTGWGIACLPQAPQAETQNLADGMKILPSHDVAKTLDVGGFTVNDYGLTLNAAFLLELRRQVVEGDFQLLLTLSGRIPKQVRDELMARTGWEIVEEHRTEQPILHDKDTGVDYMKKYAAELVPEEGDGFFERQGEEFVAISPHEAEERRKAHLADPDTPLNAYHNVSIYQLRPATDAIVELGGVPAGQLYTHESLVTV